MDTAIDNTIYVRNEDNTYVRFHWTQNGIYVIDITYKKAELVMGHTTVKKQ